MIPIVETTTAIIIDASVAIAVCAREADKEPQAREAIENYSLLRCLFFAPNIIVTETLYVLCKKAASNELTSEAHAQAITDFEAFLTLFEPRSEGDFPLMRRTEEIRGAYSCRRSADGIYIALAEEISTIDETILLTFDQDIPKQAARYAPTITVQLLPTVLTP